MLYHDATAVDPLNRRAELVTESQTPDVRCVSG